MGAAQGGRVGGGWGWHVLPPPLRHLNVTTVPSRLNCAKPTQSGRPDLLPLPSSTPQHGSSTAPKFRALQPWCQANPGTMQLTVAVQAAPLAARPCVRRASRAQRRLARVQAQEGKPTASGRFWLQPGPLGDAGVRRQGW